jgi:cytoskeletal protein CcmA (bactofilin family)
MSTDDIPGEPRGLPPLAGDRIASVTAKAHARIEPNSQADAVATVVGADATFKGAMSYENSMRLHGKLEGTVNTPGRLHISKEASMDADVDAGAITVEGDVHGNLNADDRVELGQSARYAGDLRSTRLVVHEGAVLDGHFTVGPDAVERVRIAQPGTAAKAAHVSVSSRGDLVK